MSERLYTVEKAVPLPALVTVDEVRKALGGCSKRHVYDLAKRGEITKVRVGGKTHITGESLASYLNSLGSGVA